MQYYNSICKYLPVKAKKIFMCILFYYYKNQEIFHLKENNIEKNVS